MILLAAATFFKSGIQVEELQQAKSLLEPLLGSNAAIVFALALLMAGIHPPLRAEWRQVPSLRVFSVNRIISKTATRR